MVKKAEALYKVDEGPKREEEKKKCYFKPKIFEMGAMQRVTLHGSQPDQDSSGQLGTGPNP